MSKKSNKSHPRYVVAYARKSTDEKDKQIMSIKDQSEDLTKSYNLGLKQFPLKLLDETASAYKPCNRPVFDEILRMCDRGEVAEILVVDATRISRNPEDSGRFIQRLASGVIPKVTTIGNGSSYGREDTNTLFMLMLETAMSWKYSADNGGKVSSALKKKAERGEIIGKAPLGYKNMGPKGETWVEFEDNEAPQVEHIFSLAASGAYSLTDLRKEAKAKGLRTRSRRNRTKGTVTAPKPLSKNSISNMLKNPFYKGYIAYKGELFLGKHQPLIPIDIWQRANLHLAERYKGGARTKKDKLRELFVMRGVVRCGYCERQIVFYQAKKGRYVYGECKGKCGICMNQDKLLKQLHKRISFLELENGADALLREDMQEVHDREMKREKNQRSSLETEYSQVLNEIGDLFTQRPEAERQGVLDAVDAKLATLKMRKNELHEAMQQLHDEGNDWIDHLIKCFELAKMASEAIKYGSPEARLAILKALGSNYLIKDEKLVWELPSPFKERLSEPDCTNWGEIRGSNP